MQDVVLSPSVQGLLVQMQSVQASRLETGEQLAPGRRPPIDRDDPQDVAEASALAARAGDLMGLKDGIGQALSTIEGAAVGLDALSDLTAQLRGVAASALGGSDTERLAAAEQFETIRTQISFLAADVERAGVSLLGAPPETLGVPVGDLTGATVTVSGIDASARGLGIGAPADFNTFATDADIEDALFAIDDALDIVSGAGAEFTSQIAALSVREDFSARLASTLEGAAGALVRTDVAAGAVEFLAANIRTELTVQGLRLAQESETFLSELLAGRDLAERRV